MLASVSSWLEGWFDGLPWPALLAATALVAFLESAALVGLLVPGETGVLVGSTLAASAGGPLPAMVAATTAAIVAGELVSFTIGRRWGPSLQSSPLGRRVGPDRWERGHRLLRGHGGTAVAMARFVPIVQVLVPVLAGSSGMPGRRFLRASCLGALVWSTLYVNAGYLADRSAGDAGTPVVAVAVVILAVACAVIGKHLGGRLERLASRRRPPAAEAAPAPTPSLADAA